VDFTYDKGPSQHYRFGGSNLFLGTTEDALPLKNGDLLKDSSIDADYPYSQGVIQGKFTKRVKSSPNYIAKPVQESNLLMEGVAPDLSSIKRIRYSVTSKTAFTGKVSGSNYFDCEL
jgi:hypothetical protein